MSRAGLHNMCHILTKKRPVPFIVGHGRPRNLSVVSVAPSRFLLMLMVDIRRRNWFTEKGDASGGEVVFFSFR